MSYSRYFVYIGPNNNNEGCEPGWVYVTQESSYKETDETIVVEEYVTLQRVGNGYPISVKKENLLELNKQEFDLFEQKYSEGCGEDYLNQLLQYKGVTL
jgi:hypothetical protein